MIFLQRQLMKDIGKGNEMDQAYYFEWPVFRTFRKSEEFLVAYKAVFEEEFPSQKLVLGKSKEKVEALSGPPQDA